MTTTFLSFAARDRLGRVEHVFEPDHRLGVGVGDRGAGEVAGQVDDVLGKHAPPLDVAAAEAAHAAGRRCGSDVPRGSFISSGFRWEMSQFWQFRQRKPQPVAAMEKMLVPGKKWNSGFFSMGSTWNAQAIAVGQRVEFAVLVDAIAAAAAVFRLQQALVGAELALDVLAEFQVVAGLLDPAAFLPLPPEASAGGVAVEDFRRPWRPATRVLK